MIVWRTRGSGKSGGAQGSDSNAGFRERIISIQRLIDVREDGWVGPETLSRLETMLAPIGLPLTGAALTVSSKSLAAVVDRSSPSTTRSHLARPVWPGAIAA